MNKEVIKYKDKNYTRYPESSYSTARYFQRQEMINRKKKTIYLHRVIWEETNGNIPRGYIVHHVDEDITNNDINNLQCIPIQKHSKDHVTKRCADNPDQVRKSVTIACASHKVHVHACQICGEQFVSKSHKSKYCSKECKHAGLLEMRRKTYKPVHPVVNCDVCGNEFIRRNTKTLYCSAECRTRAKLERIKLKRRNA